MENQSRQIANFIEQHLNQGFSETDVRNHLLANGRSQEAVNQAFERYHYIQDSLSLTTIPQPTSPQSQHSKKRKSSIIKRVVIALVIVIVGLIALFHFLATSPEVPKALDKLASPALQRNADNTNRENDVAMIASALATFISGHQNAFPQSTATDDTSKTLDICGSDCTPANRVTVQLEYYANTPAAVSFHSYASNLTVPDTKTVYIVPNANCNSDKSGIGVSATGQKYPSIVVLYAIQPGTSTQKQCLSPY